MSLTIGLVHNWPGKRNSELDLIQRIIVVLDRLGHIGLILDPWHNRLNAEGGRQGGAAQPATCDLVLNLHYLNPKWGEPLSYVVNWNPLEYIVNDPITGRPATGVHLDYLTDCLRSHDRVLTAGSNLLDGYSHSVRRSNHGRKYLMQASLPLHTTIQRQAEQAAPAAVNAQNFRVFYIGTNWEKVSQAGDRQIRHAGLFETLDSSGRFSFFGLRHQDGISLWEGIAGYGGELPFDGGQSILSKTRECGVALVLSSPQHRRSGVVSTRLFQAAAAGVVIIADRNPFIVREFSDSVLYFDEGATPEESANNILQQVRWIEENWEEACARADASRQIFLDRFTLDNEVASICAQAEQDIAARVERARDLSDVTVTVHWLLRDAGDKVIEHGLQQLLDQSHKKLQLICYGDDHSIKNVQRYMNTCSGIQSIAYELLPMPTIGASLESAVGASTEWHLWYNPALRWSPDHLFRLIDAGVSESAAFCYAPFFNGLTSDKDDDVTMAFFLKGLSGGFTRLSERRLLELDPSELSFYSMLVSSRLLSDALEGDPSLVSMDLLALLLVARYEYATSGRFAFVPQLSCTYQGDLRDENGVCSEYASLPGVAKFGAYRDINTYFTMHSGAAVVASEYDRELQLSSLSRRVSSLEYLVRPEHLSRNISLFSYALHLFRHRPLMVRCIRKLQSLAARVMK